MSGKWKVRFHLGKGQHFRHFQVTSPEGERTFYDPENYYLTMENARLYNNCKVAEQIYNGRNKTVCSWIACDSVQVESIMSYLFSPKNIDLNPSNVESKYNPRVNPHWLENGKNVDSKSYPRLFTIDERVFVGEGGIEWQFHFLKKPFMVRPTIVAAFVPNARVPIGMIWKILNIYCASIVGIKNQCERIRWILA